MGRISTATPVTVQAYAVVPDRDHPDQQLTSEYGLRNNNINSNETFPAVAVTATVASLNHHPASAVAYIHSVQSELTSVIPEANGLSWIDTYFDDEYTNDSNHDPIIAVFDFNYEEIESYYSKIGWCMFGSTFLCGGIFWTGVVLGVPCFLNQNVRWNTRSQHVAITRTGIVYIQEQRPSCWGYSCTDIGERIVTIPFDTIRDCKVIEASGTTCLCIDNALHNVIVHTKSSSNMLAIEGLKNPDGFCQLVFAMKRYHCSTTGSSTSSSVVAATTARVAQIMERGNVVDPSSTNNNNNNNSGDVPTLLREIRDELRQHNEVLQQLRTTGNTTTTAVPSSSSVGMVNPTAPIEEPTIVLPREFV